MRIVETKVAGFDGFIRRMEIPDDDGVIRAVVYGVLDLVGFTFTWFDNLTDAIIHGIDDYQTTLKDYKRACPGRTMCERGLALLRNNITEFDREK